MVTIARIVEKIVKENPSLELMLSKDLISYSKLARYIRDEVRKEMGKEVKDSAIVVAISRLQERAQKMYEKPKKFSAKDMRTHSNLMEIAVVSSSAIPEKMSRMYSLPELEGGGLLNATEGANQATFVFSETMEKSVKRTLAGEKVLVEMKGLSQISISFCKEMFETPGFMVYVLKELSWNGINVVEVFSTYTEMSIVVGRKDLTKAYEILAKSLF
ncbi:MAG: ACT domain-containing protein [Candidatus ainarchaeum sp.]|nr:ACT domain-containing protein [Candidatus ainarchaeum sp.]